MPRIPNLRWWIAGMLAVATALNYLDRQSFPVVVRVVQRDIPISDREYSALQSAFLLAYSLMYAGGGRMVDRLGTRTGYTIIIIWWSVANFLHGLATSVVSLGVFRFFLGLGEGGAFPGSAKAVSEWFPRQNVRSRSGCSTQDRASVRWSCRQPYADVVSIKRLASLTLLLSGLVFIYGAFPTWADQF